MGVGGILCNRPINIGYHDRNIPFPIKHVRRTRRLPCKTRRNTKTQRILPLLQIQRFLQSTPISHTRGAGDHTNCSLVNLNVLAYEYPSSNCPPLLCVGIAGSLSALEIRPSPVSSSPNCVNAFKAGRAGGRGDDGAEGGFVAARDGVEGAEEGGVCWVNSA